MLNPKYPFKKGSSYFFVVLAKPVNNEYLVYCEYGNIRVCDLYFNRVCESEITETTQYKERVLAEQSRVNNVT